MFFISFSGSNSNSLFNLSVFKSIPFAEKAKVEFFKNWFDLYNIDGVIFHDSKTCFNNSNAKFGLPQRMQEETGIPTLIIEGDLCDLRFFSEAQSITKIETFIEQIENSKVAY